MIAGNSRPSPVHRAGLLAMALGLAIVSVQAQTGRGGAPGGDLVRTVRMALWGGEEQRLLSSRAYVTQHFADRATMTMKGPRSQQLDVVIGANYRAVVVWAPKPNREFICFEPMAGITNAMNLAQRGLYKELQHVPPGGSWTASFWIRPRGF